ncbi:MAG: acyl-CoA thioesterase [Pseudomonadota bacterium]
MSTVARDVSAEKTNSPAPAVFVYRHVVTFEETNLVGNVYYARHIAWQGRCREMFLRHHAPSVLDELAADLRMVTLQVRCEYFDELLAFDEVDISMRLAHQQQHRIGLDFDYWVERNGSRRLAASGFQETGCLRVSDRGVAPISPPADLMRALEPFRGNA